MLANMLEDRSCVLTDLNLEKTYISMQSLMMLLSALSYYNESLEKLSLARN